VKCLCESLLAPPGLALALPGLDPPRLDPPGLALAPASSAQQPALAPGLDPPGLDPPGLHPLGLEIAKVLETQLKVIAKLDELHQDVTQLKSDIKDLKTDTAVVGDAHMVAHKFRRMEVDDKLDALKVDVLLVMRDVVAIKEDVSVIKSGSSTFAHVGDSASSAQSSATVGDMQIL
jgi:hypothetical protein